VSNRDVEISGGLLGGVRCILKTTLTLSKNAYTVLKIVFKMQRTPPRRPPEISTSLLDTRNQDEEQFSARRMDVSEIIQGNDPVVPGQRAQLVEGCPTARTGSSVGPSASPGNSTVTPTDRLHIHENNLANVICNCRPNQDQNQQKEGT
jgi:hypothetical protein